MRIKMQGSYQVKFVGLVQGHLQERNNKCAVYCLTEKKNKRVEKRQRTYAEKCGRCLYVYRFCTCVAS